MHFQKRLHLRLVDILALKEVLPLLA